MAWHIYCVLIFTIKCEDFPIVVNRKRKLNSDGQHWITSSVTTKWTNPLAHLEFQRHKENKSCNGWQTWLNYQISCKRVMHFELVLNWPIVLKYSRFLLRVLCKNIGRPNFHNEKKMLSI
jgi:hypothetical protein